MSNMYHSPPIFREMPPAVKGLIIACLAGFILPKLSGQAVLGLFGLVPVRVTKDLWLWQIVTYMFLHGGLFHLLLNMLALWMFGRVIEFQWGSREFLKYYFFTGICAALLNLALSPRSSMPVIGASGAIYGLLTAFAMLFPDAVIYLYFFIPLKARHAAILFAILELWAGVTSAGGGMANFAHFGGMAAGYLYLKQRHIMGAFRRMAWNISDFKTKRKEQKTIKRKIDLPGEVDKILDKILVQGADSLTEEEKQIMRKYSRLKKNNA